MATYTAAGAGIEDKHSPFRTTLAGICTGTDGLCILEVEETNKHRAPSAREYAEVALSLTGARQLRALLDTAITRLERGGYDPAYRATNPYGEYPG